MDEETGSAQGGVRLSLRPVCPSRSVETLSLDGYIKKKKEEDKNKSIEEPWCGRTALPATARLQTHTCPQQQTVCNTCLCRDRGSFTSCAKAQALPGVGGLLVKGNNNDRSFS